METLRGKKGKEKCQQHSFPISNLTQKWFLVSINVWNEALWLTMLPGLFTWSNHTRVWYLDADKGKAIKHSKYMKKILKNRQIRHLNTYPYLTLTPKSMQQQWLLFSMRKKTEKEKKKKGKTNLYKWYHKWQVFYLLCKNLSMDYWSWSIVCQIGQYSHILDNSARLSQNKES